MLVGRQTNEPRTLARRTANAIVIALSLTCFSLVQLLPGWATDPKGGQNQALWRSILDLGDDYFEAANYPAASQEYMKVLPLTKTAAKDAKASETLRSLSAVFVQLKKYDQALTYAQEALHNDTQNAARQNKIGADYLAIGRALLDQNKDSEALDYISKGVTLREKGLSSNNPNLTESWNLMAKALRKAGRASEAASYEEKSKDLQSKFMTVLQKKIKSQWSPPKQPTSNLTEVRFKLLANGEAKNIRVHQSSGNSLVDQEAIAAVGRGQPYEKFDSEDSNDNVHVEFTFQYNVFGKKRSVPYGSSDITKSEELLPSKVESRIAANQAQQARDFEALHGQLDKLLAVGTDPSSIGTSGLKLSKALLQAGDFQETIQVVDKLLAIESIAKADDIRLRLLTDKGQALYSSGRLNDAETILQQIIATKSFGETSKDMQKAALETYAKALYKQGKEVEAKPVYDRLKQL